MSPLLLALLVAPIATELPERVSSRFWIRRGRDPLAFGGLTGAVAFQGSLLPAMGRLRRDPRRHRCHLYCWSVNVLHYPQRADKVWQVALNGILYIAYLAMMLKH